MGQMARHDKGMKILVIDGSNICHRSHWGMSSTEMRDEAGNATWALHGIVTTISRLINDVGPTHVIVAGDAKGTSDTRRAMLPEYKATRSKAEPDLRYALDTYPRLLESIGISFLSDETWEGDDVMSTEPSALNVPLVGPSNVATRPASIDHSSARACPSSIA